MKHLRYLKYVAIHKWHVFWACFWYGLIWRGLIHDWSKFLPSEWFPYAEYFYGEKVAHATEKVLKNGEFVPLMITPEPVQRAFDVAWNYHQKRNSHHWQFWLLTPDKPRPNFTHQSPDGGQSHGYIRSVDGKFDVAIIHDNSINWWKPDWNAVKQLERDLDNTPIPLEMPDADRKEMLADWIGAGRTIAAIKGKVWFMTDTCDWYEKNKDRIQLHPETRAWVEQEMVNIREDFRRRSMLGIG